MNIFVTQIINASGIVLEESMQGFAVLEWALKFLADFIRREADLRKAFGLEDDFCQMATNGQIFEEARKSDSLFQILILEIPVSIKPDFEFLRPEILKRIAQNKRVTTVASELGLNYSTLYGWCKANSIPLKQGPDKFKKNQIPRKLKLDRHLAQIETMVKARLSNKEICKALGCQDVTWYRWLKARGVKKLRPIKEHKLDPHREDIVTSLAKNETYPSIAERHEVSVPILRGWLKNRKIEIPKRQINTVCAAIVAPHQQEIKVRLANGESIQVIAEEYGVKPSSLKNWLRRNGWCKANSILLMQGPNKFRPKRKKRELKLDRHRAEIEKMIEARWSTKEICKALGCEVNTWHRWIKARGVTKLRLVKEHRLDPHREDVEASLANDEPYPAIAARHEVSVPTLRGWLKSRKIEKPQRRIKTVCAAIVAPHLQEIEARIAKGELIRVLAEEHGVKPSSLAGWLRRKKTSKQNQES